MNWVITLVYFKDGENPKQGMKISRVLLYTAGIRHLLSLHPHSGEGTPPLYGDYEAQRHWMEITLNLPVNAWYRKTPHNDLLYWGLDYPPLTAYISLFCGSLSRHFDAPSMELHASRGYETDEHKVFMRFSVLALDFLVYFPAAWAICRSSQSITGHSWGNSALRAGLALAQPAFVLIDHAHFQYNAVSLGLALGGAAACVSGQEVAGSILFCLSLNFKQMSLYYAPVFFFYLLGRRLRRPQVSIHIIKLAATVFGTFTLLWAPFCIFASSERLCWGSLSDVLGRLFPFSRGLFEDKVANLWYTLSVVVDLRAATWISSGGLRALSVGATLLLLTPIAWDLLARPDSLRAAELYVSGHVEARLQRCCGWAKHRNVVRFLLALFNSGMAFFLCSFQVHEKSFLLPLVPLSFLALEDPLFVGWLSCIAVFSMHPLLLRDGVSLAYIATTGLFLVALRTCFHALAVAKVPEVLNKYADWHSEPSRSKVLIVSGAGALVLHGLRALIPPPKRYPDLYPLLFSVYSFGHFVGAWIYGICWQRRISTVVH